MTERIPLALLPGLLCDAALWAGQRDDLADIADCWVADFTTQDSLGAMAASVLAAMPWRFALAGLSMGGYVALEIMARAPERVERLALLDSRARGDPPAERSRRRGLIELAQKGQFKGVAPRLLPLYVHPARLVEGDPLAEAVSAMAMRIGRDAFIRQQQAILGREDRFGLLRAIACPTLVLCGRQDQLTPPAFHSEIAEAVPDSSLVIIEDCGHLAPMERPDAVSAAMRSWLGKD